VIDRDYIRDVLEKLAALAMHKHSDVSVADEAIEVICQLMEVIDGKDEHRENC
jgi:hypothetical protein